MTLLAAASAMSAAFAADGFSATVDIASSLFSVKSATAGKADNPAEKADPVQTVDSLVKGADFDATEFAFAYGGGNWGATLGLGFKPEADPITDAAYGGATLDKVFEFNSVTGWVKFGDTARVQAGKFSSRSANRRTADINDYQLGVFFPYFKEGEGLDSDADALSIYQPGSYFNSGIGKTDGGPQRIEGDLLKNGLLTSLYAGPATFDLLFAPNADLKAKGFSDDKARTYLYGARAAAQIGDIAKITGTFKQERTIGTAARLGQSADVRAANAAIAAAAVSDAPQTALDGADAEEWLNKIFDNTSLYDNTFGVFAEIDPVPEVGITVGYTGYLPALDITDTKWGNANHKSTLYSGIDLRVQYAASDALSVSTHDNVSFAKGKETSAFLGEDEFYVSLYNAVGATYRLNDTVKLVGEVENEYASFWHEHSISTNKNADGKLYKEYFAAVAKTVYAVSPNASVSGGLKFEYNASGASGEGEKVNDKVPVATTSAVFSVPVGFTFAW
ncbi:hypothetical protein [Treponema endosymbiont of Eucomonympha sp.]|uniref:hypothetical protein n=1 Tax=Treponema endosymbiont of Eucomonympha sp. TaxID=1580831 RepID=UPI000750F9F0|nr:hypothetical protein [Treponema endosymbiont of Eucomonympha sp.]